ncbi:Peptidase family M41 [Lachnospiraceae bacterium]|nr:Peptidase family M41 [Lachnospiraceae bacterium]
MSELLHLIHVPDNIFTEALAWTIIIPFLVLSFGNIIRVIADILTAVIGKVTGPGPAFVIRNYVTYPGTIHHEFAHALIAAVTGAKVTKITLFPKGETLGQVEFIPRGNIFFRSLQYSASAVAPVICGGISLSLMYLKIWQKLTLWWHYPLFIYLFISILFHMTMSSQDMKNFIKGLVPTLMVIYAVTLIFLAVH